MMSAHWQVLGWDQLTPELLYKILQVRQQVFVVEQNCFYQDLDDKDQLSQHVLALDDHGKILAYARVLPAGLKYDQHSIGRVLVTKEARGLQMGKQLIQFCLQVIDQQGPQPVRISAQAYLQRFYQQLGFETISDPYDEAGIPHLDMLRNVVG